MTVNTRRDALRLMFTAPLLVAPILAHGEEYPAKPIRVVIPNGPGTLADLMIRIMAPDMSQRLGQPIVVENRPGANQLIGYEYVAKQVPPDGYTLVTVSVTSIVLLPLLSKDVRLAPSKDLPPIIGILQGPLFLAAPASAPYRTFAEFVTYAKAHPGKLNFSSSTPSTRIPIEIILQQLGLDLVHIPYPSTAASNKAMMTGEVQLGLPGPSDLTALGDSVRVLAVSGDKRYPTLPNVPTFAELGFPQVPGAIFSLNGPAGLPSGIVTKLFDAAAYALRQPAVKAQLAKLNAEVNIETPAVAAKHLETVETVYTEAVRKIGLQPQ